MGGGIGPGCVGGGWVNGRGWVCGRGLGEWERLDVGEGPGVWEGLGV